MNAERSRAAGRHRAPAPGTTRIIPRVLFGALVGVSLAGGVAGGLWGDVHQAVEACVRTHSEVQPVAEWIDPYRELRERYRALYPALQAITEETP